MLLQNATIFLPDETVVGDLRIVDGCIETISAETLEKERGEEVIDLTGHWIWPGAIDAHVHFRDPGHPHKEDFRSGSLAAVAGGVTTVCDMPNTTPATTTEEALAAKQKGAKSKAFCHIEFFFGASTTNFDIANELIDQTVGLKIFMGCSTGDLLVSSREELDRIFEGYKGLICVHAESEERIHERTEKYKNEREHARIHSVIRDNESAREAVGLACELGAKHGRRLHVLHLSTKEELAEIEAWKKKAPELEVTCEVCPHHLFMDTSAYEEHGNLVRMNPPLRSPEDVETMWEALLDGRIAMIATDHAPHTLEEKGRPYVEAPSGVPGVETMLPLMLDAAHKGRCSYRQVMKWVCENPAKIYSMGNRGRIERSLPADLVVINPELKREVRNELQKTRCGWSPWHGRTLIGWPVMTFVDGKCVYKL